ncbi:MAG: orotidine-5'-phosphate decarboxylase [Rhodospirillales bacterium]|nr:orotidine-5'-phosphate decarboxylase [Rhodospirillales bacterium]
MTMNAHERIFVAFDMTSLGDALELARSLSGLVGGIKLGHEFFTACGPDGVRRVSEVGLPIFLDLKFHDIPTTVAHAVAAASALRPFMLNVHGSGGEAMLRAAAEAAAALGDDRPLVLAVTVLTSLADADLAAIGVAGEVRDQVTRLALLAKGCGLDGVVCAASEIMALRGAAGGVFKLVVPGVRPSWAAVDDHKRVLTPGEAVALGADYLVIGRPITGAARPQEAAQRIVDEVAAAGA